MGDLQVGQELYCVPRDNRCENPFYATVERLGTKWAYLDGRVDRIDKNTLTADGKGFSPRFQAWVSKDAWQESIEAEQLWRDFVNSHPSYSPPPNATPALIRQAAQLLGIGLPKKEDADE